MQEEYFCQHEAEENVHQALPSLSNAFYVFTEPNKDPGYEQYIHDPHACHYLIDHDHNHDHHHSHTEESQKLVDHVPDDNISRVTKLSSYGRYSGVKSRYMDHFKKTYDLKGEKSMVFTYVLRFSVLLHKTVMQCDTTARSIAR